MKTTIPARCNSCIRKEYSINKISNCRCSVSHQTNFYVLVDDQVLLVAYIASGSAGIVLVVLAIFIGAKICQAKSILENNLNERQVGIFKTWSTRIDHY